MKNKIATLFDCIKTLCESDIERIISFVLDIASANQQLPDRPTCPRCGHTHVIKYGTSTLAYHSHFSCSIWANFIRDTMDGKTLDDSAEELGFSHQTAFNMRHKVLMAFQDMLEKEPVILSGVTELDETFVLDCYKGKQLPEESRPCCTQPWGWGKSCKARNLKRIWSQSVPASNVAGKLWLKR